MSQLVSNILCLVLGFAWGYVLFHTVLKQMADDLIHSRDCNAKSTRVIAGIITYVKLKHDDDILESVRKMVEDQEQKTDERV